MKILVPLKRVPDPDSKIRLKSDGSGLDMDGIKFAINPFDAIALEEALRIREQLGAADILVVGIGSIECQEQLRAGLAMGADRGLLVRCDLPTDSLAVAKLLAAICRQEKPDLVLLGKQAIDDDSNQTGQMLAALLELGQATFVSSVKLAADAASVTCCRETDAGIETVSVTMPAVLTADLRLNEPRYVSALGIMKAKKKPLTETTPAELNVDATSQTVLVKLSIAPRRKAGLQVKSVDELIQKLRVEARVI